jgi:hypothetical protein
MPTTNHGVDYVEEAQASKEVTINAAFDAFDALVPFSGAGSPEGVTTASVGNLYRDTTNGKLYLKQSGAGNTGWKEVPASGTAPVWVKVSKVFGDLAAAALTNDIEVLSLGAAGVIHAVKIKHSAAFTGGAIATYTLSVGIVGNLVKYAPAFNVFQAPGNTVFQVSSVVGSENHGAATSIRLAAVSTGANLNAATSGAVDVWALVSFAL